MPIIIGATRDEFSKAKYKVRYTPIPIVIEKAKSGRSNFFEGNLKLKNGNINIFQGTDVLSETGVASGYQSYNGCD